MSRVVAACTGNDGNTAFSFFNGHANKLFIFGLRQCGRFARRHTDKQGVGAVRQLKLELAVKCLVIDGSIGVKRRDKCRAGTGK